MASSAWNLERFVWTLESWGLTDVMLPFLLIFILFFAILEKSNVLGAGKKNLNAGLSLVIALLVVIPHVLHIYPPDADVIEIINTALPAVSLVVVAIIMLMILLGIFGGDARFLGAKMGNWVAIISLIIIIFIFGGAAGWWGTGPAYHWWDGFFGSDAIAIIIILLVFGLIIAFVTHDSGEAGERGYFGKLSDDLKGIFGGGKN